MIPKLTDKVDENRIEALKLAVQSGYFMNYFVDGKTFEKYFSYLQDENSFNLEHFLKVRPFIDSQLPDHSDFKGKSIVIFGEKDPSFKMENELPVIQKSIPDIQVEVVEDVKHYPHIESKDLFVERLFNFVKKTN